jgi:hypothetical protein
MTLIHLVITNQSVSVFVLRSVKVIVMSLAFSNSLR